MPYIDKELIEKLKTSCIAKYPLSYINGILAFAKEIAEMPTADVVEVVRCGKCKHWKSKRKGILDEYVGDCHNTDFPFNCEHSPIMSETDFCSYGERIDICKS